MQRLLSIRSIKDMIFVDSHIGDSWVESVKFVTEIAGIKSVLLLVKLILIWRHFQIAGKSL